MRGWEVRSKVRRTVRLDDEEVGLLRPTRSHTRAFDLAMIDFADSPSVSRLFALLTLPIYLTATVVHRLFGSRDEHFTGVWEERLHYSSFLQGIPAILGVGAAGVVGYLAFRDMRTSEQFYAGRATAAVDRGDWSEAEICYGRLLSLRPNEPRYRFGLGLVASSQEDESRALQWIRPLIPDVGLGFPPAHLWLVDRLLGPTDLSAEDRGRQLKLAEAHLIRLRDDADYGGQARQTLVRLYLATGKVSMVVDDPQLRSIAEADPETRMALVQELAVRGRTAEVQAAVGELVREFDARVRAARDDRKSRLLLCKALALSNDLRTAARTAEEGLKLDPQGPFGELLADLTVARAAQTRTVDGLTDEERRGIYRRAAELLEQFGRESPLKRMKLAELAAWLDDDAEVERQLLQVAADSPQARLQLADRYVVQNRRGDAEEQWRLVGERFAKLPTPRQGDVVERLAAATAALRLKNYEVAERLLFMPKQVPAATSLLSVVYAEWSDALVEQLPEEEAGQKRFVMLRKAFQLDAWNPLILQRLLKLTRSGKPLADEVRSMVLARIAEGQVPAAAYLMLGTEALQRGDRSTAMSYLEHAYRLRPDAVDVMNNLAWAYLEGDEADPNKAVQLVSAALSRSPGDPRIMDTRFRAYAKLKQWPEALADLEGCAAAMTGDRTFHATAAEVYEHMKLPEVALEHRRRASLAKPDAPTLIPSERPAPAATKP